MTNPIPPGLMEIEDPKFRQFCADLGYIGVSHEGDDPEPSPEPLAPKPDIAAKLRASRAEEPSVGDEPDKSEFGVLQGPVLQLLLDYPEAADSAAHHLTPQHFKLPEHKFVMGAIGLLWEKGITPTRLLVEDQLQQLTMDDTGAYEANQFCHRKPYQPQELTVAKDRLRDFVRSAILDELQSEAAMEARVNLLPAEYANFVNEIMGRALAVSATGKQRFTSISAAELATGDYKINYLVDGILVEGQPCVIGGPQKGLKTSIAIDLAVALAVGGCFLGRFPVAKLKRVGVLSAESGMASLQDTARRVCKTARRPLSEIGNLVFCDVVPRLSDPEDMAAFAAWLDAEKLEVIVLDPFYLMADGTEAANVFLMGQQLRALAELCLERGITPVVCHHLKKVRITPNEPAGLEELTYAGCAEFFRQWLLLSRREKYESDGNHKLWLTVGGSAGHTSEWALDVSEGLREDEGGRKWQTSLQRRDEAKENQKEAKEAEKATAAQTERTEWRAEVLQTLDTAPAGMTKSRIEDYSKVPKRQVPGIIAELLQAGLIQHCKVSTSGNNKLHDGFCRTPERTGPPEEGA